MFTDADLSSPIEEAERLFAAINEGADIAIGSRWLEVSRQTIKQPIYRQFFGRCFNAVTRWLMGLPFADTQCGFKAFRKSAAQTVFGLQHIERWGFDPELLFIAIRRGYKIKEVPVTWGHDERSRMSYLRDGLKMLEEILRIRWNAFTGVYDRKPAFTSSAESRHDRSRNQDYVYTKQSAPFGSAFYVIISARGQSTPAVDQDANAEVVTCTTSGARRVSRVAGSPARNELNAPITGLLQKQCLRTFPTEPKMLQAMRSATGTLFGGPIDGNVEDKNSTFAQVHQRFRALRIGTITNHQILHSP